MLARCLLALSLLPFLSGMAGADIFRLEEPRSQWIERSGPDEDWPFMARRGLISCARVLKVRVVLFTPDAKVKPIGEVSRPPVQNYDFAVISTRLPDLLTSVAAFGRIFIPFNSFEAHIARITPFVVLGKALCDQPEGAIIGPGDL